MPQQQLPSAEEVSRTLADILSGPDFESFEAGLLERLLGQLWSRFWEWIDRILPDIPETGGGLLPALIIATCLGAIWFVALRFLPERNAEASRRDPDAVPDELRTAADWLRVAAERARGAEYRYATTALYQGFVLTLERKGALAFHPSKTPGEYAMEAAEGRAIDEREKADTTTFIRTFQGLAFGHEAPTPSGYEGLEELAERVGCALPGNAGARSRHGPGNERK